MNRLWCAVSSALLLLGSGSLACAAEEDLFFSDLPIVASVSRLPQRLADAPSSVTVIDRQMIRASGARDLSDVMRLVPGFQTFARSDSPARVTYHGITDEDTSPRVQVLVDGRSLHSPLFDNGTTWSMLPVALEDIERIEVVRGSNTVSYGTNAFLGVINIITLDPSLVRDTSVSMNNGNQGVRDYTLRTGGRLGESGNFRLTLQEVKDDGLDDSYSWSDSFRNQRLNFRADVQLTVKDLLEVDFGRLEGKFTAGRYEIDALPALVSRTDDPIRPEKQSSTWLQLRWQRSLDSNSDFSLRYAYSRDDSDDAFVDPEAAPGYESINVTGDRGYRNEIEATHNFVPFADTRLIWGGSWRRDAVHSSTVLRDLGKESRDVWRGFANGEWKPSTWFTGNLGVSNEYDSLAGNHVSPRASAAVHLTPENTVRIGYSQAWRTSSIFDYRANYWSGPRARDYEWRGNPQLTSERLDTWELAYLGDWRDWNLSLDVRQFREKMRDRSILLRPAGGMPDEEQSIQDIDIDGYEFQLKWQPFLSTQLMFGHASLRIDSELSGNGERLANTLDSALNWPGRVELYQSLAEMSAPRRSTSLFLMQKLPWNLDFSIARYWIDAMKWSRNTDVDKYNRTDLRLAYAFNLAGQRGELAYTMQSFNGAHFEQRSPEYDEPNGREVDRRHWVSVRLDF